MTIGALIRRAAGMFSRSRRRPHAGATRRHQSAEAQAAKGLARTAKKRL